MGKVGRNNPCPCGSGKKYKRCCLARSGGDGAEEEFSAEDRAFALEELECFVGTRLGREDDYAYELFYRGGSQEKTLPPPLEFLLLPAPRA